MLQKCYKRVFEMKYICNRYFIPQMITFYHRVLARSPFKIKAIYSHKKGLTLFKLVLFYCFEDMRI